MSINLTFRSLLSFKTANRNGKHSNVLIISSGGIGDTILFALIFPRFRELTKENENITVLLQKEAAKVAFLFGDNVTILDVDYNQLTKDSSYRFKICKYLYKAKFRLVVSSDFLRHPKKDEVLVKACHAPEVLAMEPRPWTKYNSALQKNRTLYNLLYDSGPIILDKVLRWAQFADWLTNKNVPPPKVALPPNLLPPYTLGERPVVIFVPFSAIREKQIPASLFIAIAEQIPINYDIIISCAPGELSKNALYSSLLHRVNVFLDESSFEELIPTLQTASLVISIDTAIMHLAVAIGTKTLCLASAAYVGEIIPYAKEITPKNVTFIYTQMVCQGCLGNCIHPTENDMFPCVSRINQGQVLKMVQELLGAKT